MIACKFSDCQRIIFTLQLFLQFPLVHDTPRSQSQLTVKKWLLVANDCVCCWTLFADCCRCVWFGSGVNCVSHLSSLAVWLRVKSFTFFHELVAVCCCCRCVWFGSSVNCFSHLSSFAVWLRFKPFTFLSWTCCCCCRRPPSQSSSPPSTSRLLPSMNLLLLLSTVCCCWLVGISGLCLESGTGMNFKIIALHRYIFLY